MEMKQSSIVHADQEVGVNDPTALAVALTDVNSQFTIENGTVALATAGRSNYQAALAAFYTLDQCEWSVSPRRRNGRLNYQAALAALLPNVNGQAAPCRLSGCLPGVPYCIRAGTVYGYRRASWSPRFLVDPSVARRQLLAYRLYCIICVKTNLMYPRSPAQLCPNDAYSRE